METLYEKVIIRSESDLPKDGTYFAYLRSANQVSLMIMSEDYKPFWIKDVEWFYKPYTPAKASAEEILLRKFPLLPKSSNKEGMDKIIEAMHEFALQSREMPSEEEIENWITNEIPVNVDDINDEETSKYCRKAVRLFYEWLKSKLG